MVSGVQGLDPKENFEPFIVLCKSVCSYVHLCTLSLCMYMVLGCLWVWLHISWSCNAPSLHNSTHSLGSLVFTCLGTIKEACA